MQVNLVVNVTAPSELEGLKTRVGELEGELAETTSNLDSAQQKLKMFCELARGVGSGDEPRMKRVRRDDV